MLWEFLALLCAHYVADYWMQTTWQAENKSTSIRALTEHACYYTTAMGVASWLIFNVREGLLAFILINGVLHWFTDFMTSRASKWYFDRMFMTPMQTESDRADRSWYRRRGMQVLGADQLIHQMCLATTMWVLFVCCQVGS